MFSSVTAMQPSPKIDREVPDGGEEFYIAVGQPEVGSSFVAVHGFEFLFADPEEFWV
jgi:hypothetical protein